MRRSFVSTWRSVTLSIHAIPDYIPSYWRSVAFSINKAFDCVPFSINNEPDCVPLKGRDILHTRDTHVCLIEITWHSLYISHLYRSVTDSIHEEHISVLLMWYSPYTKHSFVSHCRNVAFFIHEALSVIYVSTRRHWDCTTLKHL